MAAGDAKYVSADNPAMNSMLQAIQLFGGLSDTKKTTSDVSSINSVLSQLQGQDFTKLLDTVFQQAAAKTPQLTTQLANATGARTGNNAPLAAALQQVLQAATTQGQAQIAQQQAQNLQTQAGLAQAKAQATQRTQVKSNTASGNAQKLMAGLQLGDKASRLLTKKSLYDNLQGVMGSSGGAGPVVQANMGSALSQPSLDITSGNLFPQTAQPTLDSVIASIGNGNTAVDFTNENTIPTLSYSGADAVGSTDLGTGVGNIAANADLGAGSLNIDDYLNKSSDIGNMDLSFSSDAGASAASGASEASTASTASSGSVPYGSYLRAASYLDSSKQKRISEDFAHGGWNDKIGDIGDAAAIYYWPLAAVHPFADAADSTLTTIDDDLHRGAKGLQHLPVDIADNVGSVMDRKYNLVDGILGSGTTANYNLPRPSDANPLSSTINGIEAAGSFVDDAIHNPGQALSYLSDRVSDRFAEVDDFAHGVIKGAGDAVSHVGNSIGDAIAHVFGW